MKALPTLQGKSAHINPVGSYVGEDTKLVAISGKSCHHLTLPLRISLQEIVRHKGGVPLSPDNDHVGVTTIHQWHLLPHPLSRAEVIPIEICEPCNELFRRGFLDFNFCIHVCTQPFLFLCFSIAD